MPDQPSPTLTAAPRFGTDAAPWGHRSDRAEGGSPRGVDHRPAGLPRPDGLRLGGRPVTLPEQRTSERRAAVRRRSLLAGRIALDGGVIAPCGVRNISDDGALIELEAPLALPEHLVLLVLRDGLAHEARLAWRWRTRAGLQFVSSHDVRRSVPEDIRRLQSLWRTLTF